MIFSGMPCLDNSYGNTIMNKSSFFITIIGFLGCVQLSVNGFNVTLNQTSYDDVQLTCTVPDESGVIGFQWRLNGTLVASFRSDTCVPVGAATFNNMIPTCESVNRMTLTLVESSNMQYSQNWSCQVIQNKTQTGEYSSSIVQLKVSPRVAPKASTERTFNIRENESIDLKIEVLSNPEPAFTWTKQTDKQDWESFKCTPHIKVESDGVQSTLKISRAQSTDEGTYRVHVDNAVGEALVEEFQLFVTDRLPQDANEPDVPMLTLTTIGLGAAVIILIVLVVVIITYRCCRKKCETPAHTYDGSFELRIPRLPGTWFLGGAGAVTYAASASSEDQRSQYDVPEFDEPQNDERPRNYGYLTTMSNS